MNVEAGRRDQVEALRRDFAGRAHGWLQGRPGRRLVWPADRPDFVAVVGVPCGDCLEVVRSPDGRHRVGYEPSTGGHWSAGITAACGRRPAGVQPVPVPAAPPPADPGRRAIPPPAALAVTFLAASLPEDA